MSHDSREFKRAFSRFMKRGLRAMQLLLDMQLKHEVLVWGLSAKATLRFAEPERRRRGRR